MRIVAYTTGIKVITKKEAARRLGVQIRWIDRCLESGDLTLVARLPGVHAVILESSVDALIERTNAVANAS